MPIEQIEMGYLNKSFKVIIFGGVIGAYASLSTFVNSLARHSLRQGLIYSNEERIY